MKDGMVRTCCVVSFIAFVVPVTQRDSGIAEEESFSRSRAVERDARRSARDARHISVYTANRFHLALVSRMLLAMPKELELNTQYCGLIGFESGKQRFGQRGHFVGNPLAWTILDKAGLGIFSLNVARAVRSDTVAVCKIDDDVLYVSVSINVGLEQPGSAKLREPSKRLGGKSVQEVVELLEGPESGLESP